MNRAPEIAPKIALVTGGNRGLGLEAGRQLVAQGLTVVLGSRNADRGAAAAGEIGAETVQLDVTEPASAAAAVDEVLRRHGRLDVLVNNAGIRLEMGSILEVAPETLREMFEVNVVAQLQMAQLVIPHMVVVE